MSVYSPVGGWTRWTLLFLSKSNTPWKLCFLCYFNFTCVRMNPFPYLWFNLRLSLYPCHFHLKKKKQTVLNQNKTQKCHPIRFQTDLLLLFWNLPYPVLCGQRERGKQLWKAGHSSKSRFPILWLKGEKNKELWSGLRLIIARYIKDTEA